MPSTCSHVPVLADHRLLPKTMWSDTMLAPWNPLHWEGLHQGSWKMLQSVLFFSWTNIYWPITFQPIKQLTENNRWWYQSNLHPEKDRPGWRREGLRGKEHSRASGADFSGLNLSSPARWGAAKPAKQAGDRRPGRKCATVYLHSVRRCGTCRELCIKWAEKAAGQAEA